MRISHKYKFIFFANPKTGSESVREILNPYSDIKAEFDYPKATPEHPFYTHMPPKKLKKVFQEQNLNFDEYYKFVMVRNPWARLVSLYEMIYGYKSTRKPSFSKKYIKHRIFFKYKKLTIDKPTFKDWLLTIDNKDKGATGKNGMGQREGFFPRKKVMPADSWRIYGSYSIDNYIMDDSRNVLVDKVIKLEDINRDLIPVLTQLNLPRIENIEIPKKNIRKHKSYIRYYDEESIDIVKNLYRYDIEKFGYQFGS